MRPQPCALPCVENKYLKTSNSSGGGLTSEKNGLLAIFLFALFLNFKYETPTVCIPILLWQKRRKCVAIQFLGHVNVRTCDKVPVEEAEVDSLAKMAFNLLLSHI